jgi:porphobilinogen synthase
VGIALQPHDLIQPFFVYPGKDRQEPIPGFSGVARLSIDRLLRQALIARDRGLKKILLFGVPTRKEADGSGAWDDEALVPQAVRSLKKKVAGLQVITDVCLCAYMPHGHCGVIQKGSQQAVVSIDVLATRRALTNVALAHARAGADWVAPSAMCRGQVGAIRQGLNKKGFEGTKILGYSAKFASAFYGPFRAAARSKPAFGDRRGYQLACDDAVGALRRIAADIKQGADQVMVKPAWGYLDIIRQARAQFKTPLVGYVVSGEYAMVEKAAAQRMGERRPMVMEMLRAVRRAGADEIITYHAKEAALWLAKK